MESIFWPIPKFYNKPAVKINLFVQVYKSNNPERQKELDFCLKSNRERRHLNVVELNTERRLTFKDYIEEIKKYEDEDVINIITNSDIIFDESILKTLHMHSDDVYTISRVEEDGMLVTNSDSADVWVFRGLIKEINDIDFSLGIWGCDGAIANRLKLARYHVVNPSKSIKVVHIHSSKVRGSQFPAAPKPWDKIKATYIPAYWKILKKRV